MKTSTPRLPALFSTALLALLLLGPTASASADAKARSSQRLAIGSAHVVKRGSWRRARALRHRQAQAKAASKAPGIPTQNPELLFSGNFDAGFSGWHLQSLSDRATLVSSGAYEGSQAARFEVQAGDVEPETGSQRSEVSGPTFNEGEDLYVNDAIRIPDGNTYSVPWQIIQQLHEEDWGGSPGMAVMLDDERALTLGSGDSSRTFWEGPVLQTDRWYDLTYRVNLSQDPSTGFVEVWLDGVQQKMTNGQTRIYGETIQAAQTYLKAGIYRSKSSTGTSIVEHDAIAVGTSYAAVTGQ